MWLPYNEMLKAGYNVTTGQTITTADLVESDLIIAQLSNQPDIVEALQIAKEHGAKIVYEMDDDGFAIHPIFDKCEAWNRNSADNAVLRCVELADVMTVTTDRIAKVGYDEYGAKDVRVLPNCLPDECYVESHIEHSPLVIGWQGGDTHRFDCEELTYVVKTILKRNQVEFVVAGWDARKSFGQRSARFIKWKNSIPEYYPVIDEFDIGIAPLQANRFNNSKSPLKALEYGARRIPVVAARRGPYEDYVKNGLTGFLCANDREWIYSIQTLIDDPELRSSMGDSGYQQALGYRISDRWAEWATLYEELLIS